MPAQRQPPFKATGAADSDGRLVLEFRPRSSRAARAKQVSAEMEDGAGAACSVRLDGLLISPLVPTGDAAAGEPFVWVEPGSVLTVDWDGAPTGAEGTMGVIWDYGDDA